ncbi:zinc finger mym-type protein 2-like: PROVISIONAL [Gigaspora margarita]|uniref:Zinc finger mym-type protein 2-like: PROVISIONAL n=1 Tax=Gigaspora margarita TaxID=4874 RepID=A0A8H4A8I9_GIGMA|nr:zinc finger mym-type protein 2-like: PROVISIONAL [Gigaspora margarita]
MMNNIITNTDLDEFEYHNTYGGSLDDELNSDNDYNTNNDAAQSVPAAQEIQVPKTPEEIQLLTSSAVQSVIQEIQTPAPTTINVSEKEIKKPKHVSKIPKMKLRVKNSPYTTSSVIAPFKPPVHPDSPVLASYGKRRRPLSSVNNNIIIQLPPSTSQSYNLNINLEN